MSDEYEELAAKAARGELTAKPGTRRQGEDSCDDTRNAFLNAAGASTLGEATERIASDAELRQKIAQREAADGLRFARRPRRERPDLES